MAVKCLYSKKNVFVVGGFSNYELVTRQTSPLEPIIKTFWVTDVAEKKTSEKIRSLARSAMADYKAGKTKPVP